MQDPALYISNPSTTASSPSVTLNGISTVGTDAIQCSQVINVKAIGNNFTTWGVNPTNFNQMTNVSLSFNQPYYLNPAGMFSGWNLTYAVGTGGDNGTTWNTSFMASSPTQLPNISLQGVTPGVLFT